MAALISLNRISGLRVFAFRKDRRSWTHGWRLPMTFGMGIRCLSATWLGVAALIPYAAAQAVDPAPTVEPLGSLQPPGPDPQKLAALVKNQTALVVLGKALFWDT